MVGASSRFDDSTWLRVYGLFGHVNCQYAPSQVTLFYARNDGQLSADKALSVLMAAKLANRPVSIERSGPSILDKPLSDIPVHAVSLTVIR